MPLIIIAIVLLLAAGCVATVIYAARSASEGFEDDGGFHHVRISSKPAPPSTRKQA